MTNTNTGNHENIKYIGLTGRMGCGKGEVVKVLKRFGFRQVSLGDMVREEAAKSGRQVSRAEMQDIGNRLRKEGGPGALGKKVREKIETVGPQQECWVIDGIRNPAEVTELRELTGFRLFGIETELDALVKRLKSRKRGSDVADEAELRKRLDREWGIGEPEGGQHVGRCMALADEIVDNNGTLQDFRNTVLGLIKKYNIEA